MQCWGENDAGELGKQLVTSLSYVLCCLAPPAMAARPRSPIPSA